MAAALQVFRTNNCRARQQPAGPSIGRRRERALQRRNTTPARIAATLVRSARRQRSASVYQSSAAAPNAACTYACCPRQQHAAETVCRRGPKAWQRRRTPPSRMTASLVGSKPHQGSAGAAPEHSCGAARRLHAHLTPSPVARCVSGLWERPRAWRRRRTPPTHRTAAFVSLAPSQQSSAQRTAWQQRHTPPARKTAALGSSTQHAAQA